MKWFITEIAASISEMVVWQQWQHVVFSLVLCRFGAVEFFFFLFYYISFKKKSEMILCLTENHLRQFGRCWWFRLLSHQIQCSFEKQCFPLMYNQAPCGTAATVVDASGDVFLCGWSCAQLNYFFFFSVVSCCGSITQCTAQRITGLDC